MKKKKLCPYCSAVLVKHQYGEDYFVWKCSSCPYQELLASIDPMSMIKTIAEKTLGEHTQKTHKENAKKIR